MLTPCDTEYKETMKSTCLVFGNLNHINSLKMIDEVEKLRKKIKGGRQTPAARKASIEKMEQLQKNIIYLLKT